jgi:Arc/MetJ-type ribon-helix-helix transcriptional regulator
MSEQIAVRIPDELAQELEALVDTGAFETKADAVRSALEAMIDARRRADIGNRIAEGYRSVPQDADDEASARRSAIRSIHEEPW